MKIIKKGDLLKIRGKLGVFNALGTVTTKSEVLVLPRSYEGKPFFVGLSQLLWAH